MTNSLLNHWTPPAKKLKEGWVKFVDKVKYKRRKKKEKKLKKIEQELIFRAMTEQGPPTHEEKGCSRVASIRSHQDSDPVRYLHSVDTVTTNVSMERYGERNPDRFLRSVSPGAGRSAELLGQRPRGHDGIQAVVRDVAHWPLDCEHRQREC